MQNGGSRDEGNHTEVRKFKGVNTVVITVKTVNFAPCTCVSLVFCVDASLLSFAASAVYFDASAVSFDAIALCVAASAARIDASTVCFDASAVSFEAVALFVAASMLRIAAFLLSVAAVTTRRITSSVYIFKYELVAFFFVYSYLHAIN